jgi:hypothetical protein
MVTITDAFLVYSFMKRLVLPFKQWPAYQHGIIDAKGKVLKKRNTLNDAEQAVWGRYDIMIANLKKLIAKVPGGSSMIGSAAAAAFLFKECKDIDVEDEVLFEQRFNEHFGMIVEDMAVNNASSGAVAALDDNPPKKTTLKNVRRIMKRTV